MSKIGTLVPTQLGAGTKKYRSTVYIPTPEEVQTLWLQQDVSE